MKTSLIVLEIITINRFHFILALTALARLLVYSKQREIENKNIYYHKDKKECDFVVKEKDKVTQTIQVCYSLSEENKKREVEGLLEAMRKYKLSKGLLLTYDQEEMIIEGGKKITVKPVWKWLLE